MALKSTLVLGVALVSLTSCGGGGSAVTSGPAPVTAAPSPTPAPAPAPAPAPSASPGQLIFAEEFNAASLDRSRWNVEGSAFFVNNEQQAYVDSAGTIGFDTPLGAEGGALVLKARFAPGFVTSTARKVDFQSGRINTSGKFAMTYGTISARIRLPANVGAWPAFWLLGYGDWPDCGETDIMENVGNSDWVSAAMHGPGYSGDTPLVKRYILPAGTDITQWHVYSVTRTPDSVAFSVDGTEYYRVTKAEVEKYGPWRFDRPQYVILNLALGGIYPYNVNKVTTPYYGLPSETVDAIKAGKVTMAVDWVRAWSAP